MHLDWYAFGLAFDSDGPFRPERADTNGEGGILALMARAQSAVEYFHLPVPQVVELGVQEEI